MISLPIPPWTSLGKKLESAIRKALYDYKMLEGIGRLGVALSGGKDSLTMLAFLNAICGKGFPRLHILGLHVIGEASCGASVGSSFLLDLCQQLKIPLLMKEIPSQKNALECYSCSRQRRRLLFDMAKSEGCSTIAFGHHRDDNAQTLLMNLLHKGEFAGLLPKLTLYKYDVTIIRPLIYLQEDDIITFAKQYGFQRITCRCPVGQRSLRKKTDLLLRSFASLYPNARANLSRASLLYGSHKAERENDVSHF